MAQPRGLRALDEAGIDSLESEAPIGDPLLDHLIERVRPSDHNVRPAPVGREGFDPSVAECDVGGLRDDVVALVAGGVL